MLTGDETTVSGNEVATSQSVEVDSENRMGVDVDLESASESVSESDSENPTTSGLGEGQLPLEPVRQSPVGSYKLKLPDGGEHDLEADEAFKIAQEFVNRREMIAQIVEEHQKQQGVIESFRNKDFSTAFDSLGLDTNQVLDLLQEQREQREAMSPEQIEIQELREEIAKRERAEEEYRLKQQEEEKKAEEEAFHKMIEAQDSQISSSISKALEGSSLPKTPESVMRLSNLMYQALNEGQNVDPSDLVEAVREDYHHEFSGLAEAMSGEQLCKMLGEGALKKIREYDLGRLKRSPRSPVQTKATQSLSSDSQSKSWISEDEFDSSISG